MQIQCHNCRHPLTVNPQGGQFQCPTCGAVNAVGAPVQPGYPQIQHQPQYVPQPPPKKDNRRALVGVAFAVLGIVALLMGWWGMALGVGLLGWAIAGALGKIKGPIHSVFPQSARKTVLAVVGIGLGSFVTMCGVMGGVAQHNKAEKDAREAQERAEREAAAKAEKKKREAEEAAAVAAHEAELRNGASKAATAYAAGLDAIETLIAEDKWADADEKMNEVSAAVAEYRKLNPVPDDIAALVPRHEALTPKLEVKRREQEAVAWIEHAEAVVGDRAKCEDKSEVDAARKQVAGLQGSDANYPKVQELNAKLDECLKNMPPPSKWIYESRGDAMGGTVRTATVVSSNSFNFDFPYQGTQNATLTIRKEKGTDVMLSIEKGQFMCDLGCSVMVRFDDAKAVRWRATGTADHSTEMIFLLKASNFVKAISKTDVLRIEAQFYQEGSRVLEFPVARFDAKKLK
jgi:LSD1 subclass zinc finger protein